jgi:FkbM family methyltransferase
MKLLALAKRLGSRFVPQSLWSRILQQYYYRKVDSYRKRNSWEDERDLQVVKHLVAPGDSVIDVGANFGFYTAYLSGRVGPHGCVSSFEPIPLTFGILSYIVGRSSLENVRLFKFAASDSNGSATMGIPRPDDGLDNYYQARLMPAGDTPGVAIGQRLEVPLRTLDSVIDSASKPITFIKLDVEGHELEAVEGAMTLVRSFKPALLIEVSTDLDDDRSPASALMHRLEEHGYSCYWYDGSTLRKRSGGDRSINYFFLRPEQLDRVAGRVRVS